MDEKTKDIADSLIRRARYVQEQGPISPAEYRALFVLGLGYMLKELDSISYKLHKLEKERG
jgi:hypothetical protein